MHDKCLEREGKISLIRLVTEHKRNCKNPNCGVSLILLRLWLERLGVKFTREEEMLFA